jgi:hypothetical protein
LARLERRHFTIQARSTPQAIRGTEVNGESNRQTSPHFDLIDWDDLY